MPRVSNASQMFVGGGALPVHARGGGKVCQKGSVGVDDDVFRSEFEVLADVTAGWPLGDDGIQQDLRCPVALELASWSSSVSPPTFTISATWRNRSLRTQLTEFVLPKRTGLPRAQTTSETGASSIVAV